MSLPLTDSAPGLPIDRRRAESNDELGARQVIQALRTGQSPGMEYLQPLGPGWVDGVMMAEQDGEEGLEVWLDRIRNDSGPERFMAVSRVLELVRQEPAIVAPLDEPVADPETDPYDLLIMGSAEFARAKFVREWLVEGVLVAGRPGIIGGPRKSLKTSIVIDLAISLASGRPFLGAFAVPLPVRTLLISGESGQGVIQETMRRVSARKAVSPEGLDGWAYWGFRLPRLGDPASLARLGRSIRTNRIGVVVIDPLYLCLASGDGKVDPANLFDVGPLLKAVSDECLEAGATPLLVHHYRKTRENHHGRPDLEDLAFAGIQEFARQWILLGRRDRYEPGSGRHRLWFAVGGSDGHSGEWAVDINEGALETDFRDRSWQVSVADAAEVHGSKPERARSDRAARTGPRAKTKEELAGKVEVDAETAFEALLKAPGRGMTKTNWRSDLNWNSQRLEPALELLLEQGRIRAVPDLVVNSGRGRTRAMVGYAVVGGPSVEIDPDCTGQTRTSLFQVLDWPQTRTDPD